MSLLMGVCFFSCGPSRYLAEGESLYTGAKLKVTATQGEKVPQEVVAALDQVIAPKPNRTLLGFRHRLFLYGLAPVNSNKKWAKKLRESWGEPPVTKESLYPERTVELLLNRLQNKGYFSPELSYALLEKGRKVGIEYRVVLDRPYRLLSYDLDQQEGALMQAIAKDDHERILVPGMRYDLEDFKLERERIFRNLRNRGYYYFHSDYLFFAVDTSVGNREFSLVLQIKPQISELGGKAFLIRKTIVDANYPLKREDRWVEDWRETEDGFLINDPLGQFSPALFSRAITWKSQSLYTRYAHQKSMRNLSRLNVFAYQSVVFREVLDQEDQNYLDAYVYLSPQEKIAHRLEASMLTRSNGFTGPTLSYSWENRNIQGRAEQLKFSFSGGFETQLPKIDGQVLNSVEVEWGARYLFPRLVHPFGERLDAKGWQANSHLDASLTYMNRTTFFTLQSIKLNFNYEWSRHTHRSAQLSPFYLNLVNLSGTSDQFESILSTNPLLRRSLDQQFMMGWSYGLTYNTIGQGKRKNAFYHAFTWDTSGNLPILAQSMIKGRFPDSEDPYQLLGLSLAQHIRFFDEFRYYRYLRKGGKLAFRAIAGVGFAYGNSKAMPYVKQFFSGGPSSIRAFRVRSLGPGSFLADAERSFSFFDQTGDIKLEANLEYRFPIFYSLKGALFVDAGNIWNVNDNENVAGGKMSKDWYKEIAVGSGAGLRLDFEFVVVRMDLATPLRKPWLPDGERWVFSKMDFGERAWRRENIILNFSLGYPF
jgi:outer membrane protein insertion porin family